MANGYGPPPRIPFYQYRNEEERLERIRQMQEQAALRAAQAAEVQRFRGLLDQPSDATRWVEETQELPRQQPELVQPRPGQHVPLPPPVPIEDKWWGGPLTDYGKGLLAEIPANIHKGVGLMHSVMGREDLAQPRYRKEELARMSRAPDSPMARRGATTTDLATMIAAYEVPGALTSAAARGGVRRLAAREAERVSRAIPAKTGLGPQPITADMMSPMTRLQGKALDAIGNPWASQSLKRRVIGTFGRYAPSNVGMAASSDLPNFSHLIDPLAGTDMSSSFGGRVMANVLGTGLLDAALVGGWGDRFRRVGSRARDVRSGRTQTPEVLGTEIGFHPRVDESAVSLQRGPEPAGLLEAPVKPKVVKDAVIRQTPSQWGVERPEMQSALEPYPTVQYSTDPESIEYLLHSPVPPEGSSLAGNYTSPVIRAVQGGPKSATLEGWEDYLTRQKGLKRDEVDLVLSALPYHKSGPTPWPRYRTIPREIVEDSIKDMYGGLNVVEADAKMLAGALGAHMRDVKPLERYIDEIKASPEYRAGTRWSQGSYSDVPDNLEDAVRLEAENLRQADMDRMRNNLREASDEYSISIGNQSKGWLDEEGYWKSGEPFTPYAFEITSDLPGIRDFDESHFGNPGAIAHVRLRRSPQGVGKRRADGLHPRSMVVDEIQSDAYQRFRRAAIHKNYIDRLKEVAGESVLEYRPESYRKNEVVVKWMEEAGLGKNPQLTRENKDKLRQHVWKNTPQEVRRSVEDIVAQRSFGVDAAQLPFRQTEQWLRVAVSEILKRAAQNGIREVVFPTGTQINRVYQGESTNPGGMYDTVLQTVIKQVSKDLGATVKRMDLDQAEKYLPSDMADPPQGLLAGKHGPDIGADPDPNTVVEISEDLGSRMRGEQPHRPVSTKMYGGAGVDIAGLLGTTVEDDDPEEFGWRDVPSLLGAAALGRRAVATTGAGRTATARGQTVSAPMRRVIDKKLVRPNERVGHFGVGRAVGDMEAFPDAINIEKDAGLRAWIKEEAPKEFPDFKADVFASAEEAGAIGKLDVTLSPYVVNTLRDNVAVDHIVEMAQSLNPDGRMLIWMRGKELKALSIGKGKEPGEWTLTGPEGSGQGQQWRDVADVEELVDAAARKSGHPLHITDVLEDTSGTLMVEVQRISQSPVPPKGIYGKSPQAKGVKASEYQPPDARTVAKRKKDTREFLDWAEKNPQGIWVPAERGVFNRSLITPGEYSRPGVNTLPPISPRSTASAKEGGLLRQISSGSMRGLLDRQAKLGLRQGGETFYNLLPVEAFIESIGRPKNSFRDFVAATSVSSSQNPVLREIASASILLYSKANNISVPQAMAEYLRRYPEAKGFDRQFLSGWKTDTPKGGSHVDKWNKYLETGSVDPPGPASGSRKTPTYFRQKLGEEIPGSTSDVHDQKAILWPTGNEWFIENVTGGRYGLLSDVSVAGGQRLGINPEQYQAGRWIGGGPLTGLGSARGDYVQHLEDALLWTAIMAGKDTSPQGLRKLFEGVINGREFILPYYGKGSPVTRGGSLIKSLSGLGGIAAIWAQQKEAAEES